MIREIATRKSTTGYRGLFIIFIITVFVIFISELMGVIENYLGINNLEYVIYIILISLGYFLIRYFITQYRYSLFDDEFMIERLLGKKTDMMVNIFISEIVSFESEEKKHKKKDKSIKVSAYTVQRKERYCIKYKKGENVFEVIFNPSQEFINQLERATEQRRTKEKRNPDIIT